ncbi:MAG: response regulator [Deltaproteobacteria bacterium]|nr:response regulator [Deltaproteobacteria bacterium]
MDPATVTSSVQTAQVGSILVVDDDATVVRAVTRHLREFRPVIGAGSFSRAVAVLERGERLCGAVLDVKLQSGPDGFALLDRIRERFRHLPALMLTGEVTEDVLARAYDRRAAVLLKGSSARQLGSFAVRCVAADWSEGVIGEALGEYAETHGLHPGEVEMIHHAMHGRGAEWYESQGVPRSTYSSRRTRIFAKTGADDFVSIHIAILELALKLRSGTEGP